MSKASGQLQKKPINYPCFEKILWEANSAHISPRIDRSLQASAVTERNRHSMSDSNGKVLQGGILNAVGKHQPFAVECGSQKDEAGSGECVHRLTFSYGVGCVD